MNFKSIHMKCFHFSTDEEENSAVSRSSKVSWARSRSVASSSVEIRRSESNSESIEFADSIGFYEFLSQRRANDLRVFSFAELKSATRGFNRALMIGEGGFGCVYRGVVKVCNDDDDDEDDDDRDYKIDVAVKQLNRNGFQGHKEWINEVSFLGVVKHPNLVKLVGYCAEDDERGIQRLLVYELMCNKSLEDHLLSRVQSPIPWISRLKIAQDAARGLAYLHEEMDFQLIFRDFKTSNILLDEDLNAKLSDFGLARQGPPAGLSHVSTSVVGTVGYAAPEYVQTGRLTAKSDVWSFGVVVYELITGRRAVERNLPKSEQKLLDWVKPYISDSKKFHLIIDPRLKGKYCIKSAQKLSSLANKCLTKHPKSRPKMSEIVQILEKIINEAIINEASNDISNNANHLKEGMGSEIELSKGYSWNRKGFDFKEFVNFTSKSIGRWEWRNWTPDVVRTW